MLVLLLCRVKEFPPFFLFFLSSPPEEDTNNIVLIIPTITSYYEMVLIIAYIVTIILYIQPSQNVMAKNNEIDLVCTFAGWWLRLSLPEWFSGLSRDHNHLVFDWLLAGATGVTGPCIFHVPAILCTFSWQQVTKA